MYSGQRTVDEGKGRSRGQTLVDGCFRMTLGMIYIRFKVVIIARFMGLFCLRFHFFLFAFSFFFFVFSLLCLRFHFFICTSFCVFV